VPEQKKGGVEMPETESTLAEAPWRKKKMDLKNAYQSGPDCLYCGICLVDGPEPDFEFAYLFMFC
jgi:hypothetical protein